MFGQLTGQRDTWIFGTAWTIWLLYLCVAETGQGALRKARKDKMVKYKECRRSEDIYG